MTQPTHGVGGLGGERKRAAEQRVVDDQPTTGRGVLADAARQQPGDGGARGRQRQRVRQAGRPQPAQPQPVQAVRGRSAGRCRQAPRLVQPFFFPAGQPSQGGAPAHAREHCRS